MGKPIQTLTVRDVADRPATVRAVFDTGSHFTIVRESCLPAGAQVLKYAKPKDMRTATQGGPLSITGATQLVIEIGDKQVQDEVLVAPQLGQEMLVGAGTMQKWDISIQNENGHTRVVVGKDLRDPDITEVDGCGCGTLEGPTE